MHTRTHQPLHDCSVKLAEQEANRERGIFMAIPDPDADLGFRFDGLHPDWIPNCTAHDSDRIIPVDDD